jgi:hypothetical protein
VAVLAGLAAIVAIPVATRLDTAQHLSVGQAFAATAPWRLQVEGSQCSVTVTSPGGASRQGYGTNYVVQMRETGRFLLEELSSGCVAVRRPGMGNWARLPFQAGSGRGGTSGGDSLPFQAGTRFEVTVANDQCHTVVHDSGDGSVVTQFDGSDQVPSGGDFFLTLDPAPNCVVRVTPG